MDLSQSFDQRLSRMPTLGEMRDGTIRYVMMRPDVLMGMFAQMPADLRPIALHALAASAARNGGKSVQAYRDSGAADPGAMIDTIIATSVALGWGVWTFDLHTPGRAIVTVQNSPFAEGAGDADHPVCAPIIGLLQAIGPIILGAETVQVKEVDCHAMTKAGNCRFDLTADHS